MIGGAVRHGHTLLFALHRDQRDPTAYIVPDHYADVISLAAYGGAIRDLLDGLLEITR